MTVGNRSEVGVGATSFRRSRVMPWFVLFALAMASCSEDTAAPETPATPQTPVIAVAFFEDNQGLPSYAFKSSPWTVETIDPGVAGGHYISLAFDSKGVPHVAYRDGVNEDLKYATKPAGSWLAERVDSIGIVGKWASLAVDAQDRPHIAYTGVDDQDLKYTVKIGASWSTETVTSTTGIAVTGVSLFVDDQGRPHISFFDATATGGVNVRYSVKNGAVWTTETVGGYNLADFGSANSIVVDAQDRPHTTFSVESDLYHAVKDGGSWTDEQIEVGQALTGQYPSLRLDSQGELMCAYSDFDDNVPKLATQNGQQWLIEVADMATANFVRETSLALDADDNPYISYYESSVKLLKVASRSTAVWTVEVVDSMITVNSQTSIAVK